MLELKISCDEEFKAGLKQDSEDFTPDELLPEIVPDLHQLGPNPQFSLPFFTIHFQLAFGFTN